MGKKGNKRKTRWRVLPIGDDADCLYSTNEDDGDADHATASPTAANGPGSYARAAQPGRGKPGSKPRPSGYQPAYYRPHRSVPDSRQPLVTTEKKTFNEEEYTKITTPRQDVLFKKGYLGRKKAVSSGATASGAPDSPSAAANAAAVTGAALTATNCGELAPMHNGGDCEPQPGDQADVMSPTDEQPQYIYPNGYVDGVIYVNGGYEWYDPYGNVTVVVGPAPPFAGPAGGASVLAAVPCQPLPLQPIEWFNPAYGVPYVAPALPSCPRERDRRKRCSADSQNCSPQSSESTDPPGSPQEGDGEGDGEGECEGEAEVDDGMLPVLPGMMNGADEYTVYPHLQTHPPPQPPAYMYPGAYMFGQPIYSMNGITVQSTSQLPQNTDNSGSKRRKKKRRRRRRRGGVDDGSEETSSDEKDLEEPASLTSQESSQEVESDSKNSAGSASCPTIVGCPELPERTPESPSSSPSLSPSLSPSPSLSNATEDKTALPKINNVDTDVQQEKQNIRSEGNKGNIETVVNEFSLQGVDESNSLLSHVPNVEKSDDILKLKEYNLQNESVIHNGGSNINQVLVIDASKANGNYLADSGTSFELDNNLSKTDSSAVPACGDLKIESNVGFNKESVTKSNVSVSKPKSKGKKGVKIQKQKGNLPIQNGFSELQVNENLAKVKGTQVEMDGNESLLSQDISSNESQTLTTAKVTDTQTECKILPEQNIQQEENKSLSNVGISPQILHASETPKKPTRAHQSRQQQKSISCLPTSSEEKGQDAISTNSENIQIKGESSQFTVPQYDHNTNIDLTFAAVSGSESLLKSSALENVKITTHNEENTTENKNIDDEEQAKELAKEALICEVNSPKMFANKAIETICIQALSEQRENERFRTQQDATKDVGELSVTTELDTIQGNTALDRCDNNQTSNNDVKNFFCSFPEWATSTPPIPPPRRKKWQPSRKCSSDRPPTPGKELESRKQKDNLDDASSSSSHESEESVIDLMSSSPNKSKNSKDLMNEIGNTTYGKISTQLGLQQNAQSQNIKIVDKDIAQGMKLIDEGRDRKQLTKSKGHASEPDKSTASISKQSLQNSKGDQSQSRYAELKGGLHTEENCHVDTKKTSEMAATDNAAETYADDLACQLLGEGLSSAATTINNTLQSQSLSLTEAVTQWLHSQDSEEVLQVPQLLESESDIEDTEEISEEEIKLTGPKNVYRNPLLAPSCESVNKRDDAGIRVANLKNTNTPSTQKETVACQINELPIFLIQGNSQSGNDSVKKLKEFVNEVNERNGGNEGNKGNEGNGGNEGNEGKEGKEGNEGEKNKIKKTIKDDLHDDLTLHAVQLNCRLTDSLKENINGVEFNTEGKRQYVNGIKSEEFCNFSNESVEYDADWEHDTVILKTSPNVTAVFITDDHESHLSRESTDDKCSYMCDPSLSVAKYYRLGPLPEKEMNSTEIVNDFDTGREDQDDNDYDAEGMDALIHFRNELNENEYSTGVPSMFQSESYSVERCALPRRKNNRGETNALQKNEKTYDASYDGFTSDSGIQSEESSNEDSHKVSNSSSKSISQMNSILKRKSAILLSHLGAESPFPCGGICCILQ